MNSNNNTLIPFYYLFIRSADHSNEVSYAFYRKALEFSFEKDEALPDCVKDTINQIPDYMANEAKKLVKISTLDYAVNNLLALLNPKSTMLPWNTYFLREFPWTENIPDEIAISHYAYIGCCSNDTVEAFNQCCMETYNHSEEQGKSLLKEGDPTSSLNSKHCTEVIGAFPANVNSE